MANRRLVLLWEEKKFVFRYDLNPQHVNEEALIDFLHKKGRTAKVIRYLSGKGSFVAKPSVGQKTSGATVFHTYPSSKEDYYSCVVVRCVVYTEDHVWTVRYANAAWAVKRVFSGVETVTVESDDTYSPGADVKPSTTFAELYEYMSVSLPIVNEEINHSEATVYLPTLVLRGTLLPQPQPPSSYPSELIQYTISTASLPTIPSPTQPPPTTRALVIPPGTVGLTNTSGILCYVNSVVQCLSHTPLFYQLFVKSEYKLGINEDNPLGTKGELALRLGHLINQIWSPNYSNANANQFWKTVGRFRDCFSEIQQQDAQEFLAAVLDGLHEDYNKVRKRVLVPKFEPPDSMAIEEVAAESWMRYLLRNQSFVVQHCMGLLKSTLQCRTCGRGDLTFDPYMQLSLELPDSEPNQLVSWIYYPSSYPSAPPVIFQRHISLFATLDDLTKLTFKSLETPPSPYLLWTTLIFDHYAVTVEPFTHPRLDTTKVHTILAEFTWSKMTTRSSIRWLALYESLPPETPNSPMATVIVNSHENIAQQGTLHPIVLQISQDELSSKAVAEEVRRRFKAPEGAYCIRGGVFNEAMENGCMLCDQSCEGCPVYPQEARNPKAYEGDRELEEILDTMLRSAWITQDRLETPFRECIMECYGEDTLLDPGIELLLELVDPELQDIINEESDEEWLSLTPLEFAKKVRQLKMAMDSQQTLTPSFYDPITSSYYESEEVPFDALKEAFTKRCYTRMMYSPLVVKVCWGEDQSTIPRHLRFTCTVQPDAEVRLSDARGCKLSKENKRHLEMKREQEGRVHSLEDCFKLFTRVEKLEDGDRWKCPRCKKEEPSRKRFELWDLPNMLFIHIKRFACKDSCSVRLRHAVSFPLSDLDLSPYQAPRGQSTLTGCQLPSPTLTSHESPATPLSFSLDPSPPLPTTPKTAPQQHPSTYTLLGVVSHHGPDIQYGHYTAHCKHQNGKWYHYNDDSVRQVSAEEMLSRAKSDVYLLVYGKEDMLSRDKWLDPPMWPNLEGVMQRVIEENARQAALDKKEREEREERERRKREEDRRASPNCEAEPEPKRQRPSEIAQIPSHFDQPCPSASVSPPCEQLSQTLSDTPATPVI